MIIWSQELLSRARELKTDTTTYYEAASQLTLELGVEVSPEQLRSALRRSASKVVSRVPDNLIAVSELPQHLDKADFIYASDFHVPFHSKEMVRRLLQLSTEHYPHIRNLVIGGDFFDMGAASFYVHDEAQPISLEEELQVGGNLLYELMQHWDHIYYLSGNHDERIKKKLGAAFSSERLIYGALAGRYVSSCQLHISNYDWMTAGDNWLVGHPSNFSGRGGQVPVDIALIRRTNVIGAHNHRYGIQATACGEFVGIDPGCMTDGSLHWYKERRLNKFNEWVTGFVVVENGFARTFPGPFTDWNALGCRS